MTHIDYSRDTSLDRTYYIHQTGSTKQGDREISQDYELQNKFPSFFMFTVKEKCTLAFLYNYFLSDRKQKATKQFKSSIIWTYYTALMFIFLEISSDMKKPNLNEVQNPGHKWTGGKQVLVLEERLAQDEETNFHSWMTTINRERKSSLTLAHQSQVLEKSFSLQPYSKGLNTYLEYLYKNILSLKNKEI